MTAFTITDIARRMDVSRGTVYGWLRGGVMCDADAGPGRWSDAAVRRLEAVVGRVGRRETQAHRIATGLLLLDDVARRRHWGERHNFEDHVRALYGISLRTAYRWMKLARQSQVNSGA